jgi:hypothetical protein
VVPVHELGLDGIKDQPFIGSLSAGFAAGQKKSVGGMDRGLTHSAHPAPRHGCGRQLTLPSKPAASIELTRLVHEGRTGRRRIAVTVQRALGESSRLWLPTDCWHVGGDAHGLG